MLFDPIQKYLIKVNGKLTGLQLANLAIFSEDSETARKMFATFEAAAQAGDSFCATVCASIIRSKHSEFSGKLLAEFETAAHEGDPFATAMLANIERSRYSDSTTDKQYAYEFAKLAAQSDFPPGLAELGYCYEDGRGTAKNFDLALAYLSKAAQLGFAVAACHLAVQYAAGQPYGFYPKKAFEYATMASELGEAYATHLLGTWHEEGALVDKNLSLARFWYDKAARQGSGLGCIRMAAAYTLGELDLLRDLSKASEYHQLVDDMNSA